MFLPKLWPKLAWLLFYLTIGLILIINSFSYLDPDFGWHLKVGQTIAQTKTIPHDQVYMWSLSGQNWVDHEWLGNLLIYKLWQLGGYLLVSLFFVLIPLITLGLLNYYLFKNYLNKKNQQIVFAGIELFALVACLPHFGIRLQEFSFLFTAILLIIIDHCRREQKIILAGWLIPLLFLWSCLHGSFLFAIAIIIGWLSYEIILYLWPWFKNYFVEKNLNRKNLFWLTIIILSSILVTWLTPYRQELYSFLSDYGTNRYYLSHIEEWRTPYSLPFAYLQIFYTLVVIVLIWGVGAYHKKYLPLWKLVLAIGLLLMASRSVRHFPLWTVGSLLFLLPNTIKLTLADLRFIYGKTVLNLTLVCLFLIALMLALDTKLTNQPFTSYCQHFPCQAVDFLKKHPEYNNLKMFNEYGWGGFLIWVWPEKKIFIDGRLPQYKINNHSLLEEYSEFFDKTKIEQKLNDYKINLVLFKTKEPPFKPDWFEQLITGEKPKEINNPLIDYLKTNSGWKIIYSDSVASIYVRK